MPPSPQLPFSFAAESPDPATIPPTDLVGVTVTLITCCYKQREFIRVGYYVNNEHNDPAVNAEIQVRLRPPVLTVSCAVFLIGCRKMLCPSLCVSSRFRWAREEKRVVV